MIEPGSTAPQRHEIEIVVFGPGVGESVLVHLGENDWIVIDSCRYPGDSRAAALCYLERLGVNPADAVKRILATHWHDDHIQGLSEIVRECPSAQFIMSAALQGPQFHELVFEIDAGNRLVAGSSSAHELATILEELGRRGQTIHAPDFYALDGMVLFENGGYQKSASVRALSPSAQTVTNALRDVTSRIINPEEGGVRRFRKHSPNDLSVAVQVSIGPMHLLLGADLENRSARFFGWNAVLASTARPKVKSQFFKVAHHGSSDADHPAIWSDLLTSDTLAVVTPYTRRSDPLPTREDLARIGKSTNQLYCTTWPPSVKPPPRPGVDRFLKEVTRTRRAMNRDPGFVRVRIDLSNEFPPTTTTDLFGSARKLER